MPDQPLSIRQLCALVFSVLYALLGCSASANKRMAYQRDGDVAVWSTQQFPWDEVTRTERVTSSRIRGNIFPRYRPFMRVGLLGPARVFAVFVSKTPVPPDFGPESVALNQCHSTPTCKYACSGRYVDGELGLIAPNGSACEDGALFFYKDIALPFPTGQAHRKTEAPCVVVNGQAFGACRPTKSSLNAHSQI